MTERSGREAEVALIRDTAAGDAAAFRRLYDATSPMLYAVALKMMRSPAAADDVLQDAFVQIWHRAGEYHRDRGGVAAWMTSIVRYRAIDALRRVRNDEPLDDETILAAAGDLERDATGNGKSGSSPVFSAIADEAVGYLDECLSRLSGTQKQSVALAFFHGLTHQELSARLAQPLGTVKSRLRRSLLRLRECLERLGFADEIPTRTG